MLAALVVALRSLALIRGGHRAVALESLASRAAAASMTSRTLAVIRATPTTPKSWQPGDTAK
jgi:hypothetical protein